MWNRLSGTRVTWGDVPIALREVQAELQAASPDKHSVSYMAESWRPWFPEDQELEYLCESYPGRISRGDIAELARQARGRDDLESTRRLFLATLMWGYGTQDNRGPYRASLMCKDPRASRTLREVFSLVESGDLERAYEELSNVQTCGAAFTSKYLYFVGLGCDIEPLPLILDSRVREALKTLLGLDVPRFPKAKEYLEYISAMSRWAKELRCRPDSIEWFLFRSALQADHEVKR